MHPSSAGKALDWSPRKWRNYLDSDYSPSRRMVNGSAVHSVMLGGKELVEIKADDMRKKATKEAFQEAIAAGKLPVLTKEFEPIHLASSAGLRALNERYPGSRINEETIQWESHDTPCEGTPDSLHPLPGGSTVIEVKTTENIAAFDNVIARCHYDCQAAAYLDAATATYGGVWGHRFLVIETTAPYCVRWVRLDENALFIGERKWETVCELFRSCHSTKKWPDYSDHVYEPKPWEAARWLA